MKFEASAEALVGPLAAVCGVAAAKSDLPMLGHVLLRVDAEAGRMTLIGTDMEMQITTSCPIDAGESGDTTVPARRLLEILKTFGKGVSVRAQVDADKLILRAGRGRYSLVTLPAEDFPLFPQTAPQAAIDIPAERLGYLLNKTAHAMAVNDVRYYLNGMLWASEGGTLRCVTTDGHRLATAVADCADEAVSASAILLPRRAVLEIARLAKSGGEMSIRIAEREVTVAAGEVALACKLIDGRFPDWQRVMPKECNCTITLDTEAFIQALRRAIQIADANFSPIKLLGADKTTDITITAYNKEGEDTEESIAVERTGPGFEIGFNAQYLLEVTAQVAGGKISLGLSDGLHSCLLTDPSDESVQFIVMPMRL